jgi:hypothetical protein
MHAGQVASIQAPGAVARLRRLTRQKTTVPMTSTAAATRAGPLARSKARSASGPKSMPRIRPIRAVRAAANRRPAILVRN